MNPDLDKADLVLIERLQRRARKLEAEGDAGDEEAREDAYAIRWAILGMNGLVERQVDRLFRKYGEQP